MAYRLTLNHLRLLMAAAVLALLAVGGFCLWVMHWMQAPMLLSEAQRDLVIARGDSSAQVAAALAEYQNLRWPLIWRGYVWLLEPKTLKAGEYHFAEQISPVGMLHQFQRGEVVVRSLRFAEGLRFQDWLKILAEQPKLKHELTNKTPDEQKKLLEFGYAALEGWFFPDTYQYQAGDSDREILMRAHKKMQQTLEKLWRNRDRDLPYAGPAEALTMASIVEKETGLAAERPEIAGVFVRRLRLNMRLQTDPTVIYGLGDAYVGNITHKDLQQLTPYNTYLIAGLPPSPIANPGEAALHAALHPAPGNSLYFVGRGDGSHEFSATLEQHNKAVERFQRSGRSEKYRSSPTAKP